MLYAYVYLSGRHDVEREDNGYVIKSIYVCMVDIYVKRNV